MAKIEKNIIRDISVTKKLESLGWTVLRFWETEIKKETDKCINIILKTIENLTARN